MAAIVVVLMCGLHTPFTSHARAQNAPVTCAAPPRVASDAATPVADSDDAPSQRQILESELELLIKTFARCQSDADFTTMSRLVSEKYLGQVYGGGPRMSRETFLALAPSLPTPDVRFRALDDVKLLDDGLVRANVKLVVGNQLTFEQMTFLEEPQRPGVWLIDSTSPLRVQPPRDHSEIEVTLGGSQFTPSALVALGPNIDVRLTNTDVEDHEFMLLKLPEGISTGALLVASGPGLPAGVEYLAQITVPGGKSTNLVLVGMKPGTYAVVDLLPTESGVPHLALGMQATLTVTE